MDTPISYQALQERAPEYTQDIVNTMLAKISKSKSKSPLSTSPTEWKWSFSWAQRIQAFSFADTISMASNPQPKDIIPVEEVVANLMSKGDIALSVVVSSGKVSTVHSFLEMNDLDFFVPQEIVDYYSDDDEILDKPTTFVYTSNDNIIKETYVIGGLVEIETGDKLIAIYKDNFCTLFTLDTALPILYYVAPFSKDIATFDKVNNIKLNKVSYTTFTSDEALELLKVHPVWIDDAQSTLNGLLAQLSGSPGFMMFGQVTTHEKLTTVPTNATYQYMGSSTDPEIKSKFKIK